jgi:hypothetical protein
LACNVIVVIRTVQHRSRHSNRYVGQTLPVLRHIRGYEGQLFAKRKLHAVQRPVLGDVVLKRANSVDGDPDYIAARQCEVVPWHDAGSGQ